MAHSNIQSSITLFGFGRFGQVFYELFHKDLNISVHDPAAVVDKFPTIPFVSLEEALESPAFVYAVPIPLFEETVRSHVKLLKGKEDSKLFIDVLSVKVLAKEVFERHLSDKHRGLLTHPMFGPDSVKEAGVKGQRMVMCSHTETPDELMHWTKFFTDLGLDVIHTTAEEHDRVAARSQGLTHFIGRVLDAFGMEETPIDTLGARQLLAIKEQTCNDTWELFSGLQTQNPFTVEMRVELGDALDRIYGRLLPRQRDPNLLVVGIQGGKGSFNEEAARYYLERAGITSYKLEYLFTTERVLKALHRGEVDCGQFAVHNSTGGIVEESLLAMASHKFAIQEQFSIQISHSLMKRKDAPLRDVTTIMTHPQVIKQCKRNLSEKYPRLELTSGEGELIDSANAAHALAEGKIPQNHAVMGSKVIAELYDLDVIEDNLQDLKDNFTSFVWVERPYAE